VAKSGRAAGSGVGASSAIANGEVVEATVAAPKEHNPNVSVGDATMHGLFPLPLPPLTMPLPPPKNVLVELPMNSEVADAVGVKVMLVGDAVKSLPTNVAVVPDPDVDNDQDTRDVELTEHELQFRTMSPVTVDEPIR
jgi:hypothetical protein